MRILHSQRVSTDTTSFTKVYRKFDCASNDIRILQVFLTKCLSYFREIYGNLVPRFAYINQAFVYGKYFENKTCTDTFQYKKQTTNINHSSKMEPTTTKLTKAKGMPDVLRKDHESRTSQSNPG
jgi:hypothetical protein